MSEPYIVVREGHKRECCSNLRIEITQGMSTPAAGGMMYANREPIYIFRDLLATAEKFRNEPSIEAGSNAGTYR